MIHSSHLQKYLEEKPNKKINTQYMVSAYTSRPIFRLTCSMFYSTRLLCFKLSNAFRSCNNAVFMNKYFDKTNRTQFQTPPYTNIHITNTQYHVVFMSI